MFKKIYRILPFLLFLVFFAGMLELAFAAPQAPPEFESSYKLPKNSDPLAGFLPGEKNFRALICYTIVVALAIVFAHYLRSRRALFTMAITSIAILGFCFQGCPCPIGMTQNVVQGLIYGNSLYEIKAAIPWTMILLFFVPIVAALFYGRVFCSSACPLGAIQELTAIFPIKLPDWVDQGFGLIRYVYLGLVVMFVALGMQFLLCRFDPYVVFFRRSGLVDILWFGGILLVVGVFIARPYCRFLCPYGAILGLCSKVSMKNIKVTPGECTNCKLCEEMCPYGAIRPPTKQPDAKEQFRGPLRLVLVFCAIPLILILSVILSRQTTMWFAMFHPDVAIVPILRMEDTNQLGLVTETGSFDETIAFKRVGGNYELQYKKAAELYGKFLFATSLLGFWVGLVVSVKLLTVSLRRKRVEYEVDPSKCMACGRCFWYCPNQNENRVLLDDKITFFK